MIDLADGQKVGSLRSIDQPVAFNAIGGESLPDLTGTSTPPRPFKTQRDVHEQAGNAAIPGRKSAMYMSTGKQDICTAALRVY
jgi:hypothetical protein